MVSTKWLTEREVVAIEPTDWLVTLGQLTLELRGRPDWQSLDLAPWEIAAAWPHWRAADLSWAERANGLAARLGMNPLSANTLMRKCERMGLRKK